MLLRPYRRKCPKQFNFLLFLTIPVEFQILVSLSSQQDRPKKIVRPHFTKMNTSSHNKNTSATYIGKRGFFQESIGKVRHFPAKVIPKMDNGDSFSKWICFPPPSLSVLPNSSTFYMCNDTSSQRSVVKRMESDMSQSAAIKVLSMVTLLIT